MYRKLLLILILAALVIYVSPARATIASVTLNPAAPTVLSNGLSYYLAGKTYSYVVNVVDPDIAGWGDITDVRITIPNSAPIVIFLNPAGTGPNIPVTVSTGTVDAVADITGTFNNCIITFKVTYRWDTPESNYTAARSIVASATTNNPALSTVTKTAIVSYGVRSTITILNFAQNGTASDGMVNPWHDAFAVSGTIVYNVPGAGPLDTVDTAEITSATLYRNGATTGINSATDPVVSFAIPALTVAALGAQSWTVRAVMLTPGGPETSSNSLALNCDEVQVTNIVFLNGGGIDTPAYYRSTNHPGTQVQVTARMRNSLSPMSGNTTVVIRNYTDTQDISVLIPNGSNTGTASVGNPTVPAAGDTVQKFYRAQQVTGGSYGGDAGGQNADTRINQPAALSIYWDNNDPPGGAGTPFTAWVGYSATSYSLTFNWTGLANAAPYQDFYSYRIYYKKTTDTLYSLIDRNAAGHAALADMTTGTVTVSGLIPLTNYDYYITAVDVFGNEVAAVNSLPDGKGPLSTVATLASTIRISMTDGIASYDDTKFLTYGVPGDRPVRKTAVRVKVFIVAAGEMPDTVNLIVRPLTLPLPTSPIPYPNPVFFTDSTGVLQGTVNIDYYRITTRKTGPNEWTGFIPDTNPLITVGTDVKFIIETVRGGVTALADYDSETETPATATSEDKPFTFTVTSQPQFNPWPTRILNNVIDNRNPRAYPAYYLTDDANVTITVYDIKGRQVKTLLDNAYRKGGQNIKEGGWAGDNKANIKLGIGLYYVHFHAKRISDGKIILNSFQKVVINK